MLLAAVNSKGEEVQVFGVVLTSDRRWNKKIDTRIAKQTQNLCEFYYSVVSKRELSNTTKLLVLKAALILILTYGFESWAMTEKVQS